MISDEIPRYQKRSSKNTPRKSKHKHKYTKVIGEISRKEGKSSYIPICGKTSRKDIGFIIDIGNGRSQLLFDLEEVQLHFPDLEVKTLMEDQI